MRTPLEDSDQSDDSAGTYRIVVRGSLSIPWAQRLGGLDLEVQRSADGRPLTVLKGWMADQAALSGVLDTLSELQLTLLLVERLDDAEEK